jgi:uncharacterized protein (TIGR03067 family)
MGNESQPNYEVFISYSSKDKKWADAACAVLEKQRVRCWVAPRDIIPGTEWGAAIISGMDASRIVVVIFSTHANQSAQVRREVERAIGKGLIVLPFRIEDVSPAGAMEYALSNTHWLDGFTPPLERQFNLLARSVKALLAKEPGDTPEPEAPPVTAPARPSAHMLIAGGSAVLTLIIVAGLFAMFRGGTVQPKAVTAASGDSTVPPKAETTPRTGTAVAERRNGPIEPPTAEPRVTAVAERRNGPIEPTAEPRVTAVAERRNGPIEPTAEPRVMPAVDSLQPGSVWVGQPGNSTFTVLDRQGERFKARLVVGRLVREVNGTIKDGRLWWLARDVKAIVGGPGGDNQGEIKGDEVAMTWSDPGRPGGGQFTLRLEKPIGRPVAAPQSDQERIQGRWQAVEVVTANVDLRKAFAASINPVWTFQGTYLAVHGDPYGKDFDFHGTFSLSPGVERRLFGYSFKAKRGKSWDWLGIYEFEGELLRVCYESFPSESASDFKRPDSFVLTSGSKQVRITFRRLGDR